MSDLAAASRPAVSPRPRWYDRSWVRAIGLYLLVRCCGVLFLWILAVYHDTALMDRLYAWDGEWYLSIAEFGYGGIPDTLVDATGKQTETTPLAFFPLYPGLVGLIASLTGIGVLASALIISTIAGGFAAVALFRIGQLVDPRHSVGFLLVALWAGAPMAITLSMAYTEAMFTALAAWALVGVLERRWLLAGMCALSAGLVRPTASVLVAVVGIAALIAVFQSRQRWAPLIAMVLAPLGLLGWWTYVGVRTGSVTGWFDLEREGWNTEFDYGKESLEFIGEVLATGSSVMEVGTVFILLGAAVLAVLAGTNRLPWPLVAYAAGVVILVAGSAGLPFVKARFLLPGFALLIPVAIGLANRRRGTAIAATAGIVLAGSWFSAYALTGWEYAI